MIGFQAVKKVFKTVFKVVQASLSFYLFVLYRYQPHYRLRGISEVESSRLLFRDQTQGPGPKGKF